MVALAKVITPENRSEVLPRFFHASKGEAQAIVAGLKPAAAAPRREVVTVPASLESAPRTVAAELPSSGSVHPANLPTPVCGVQTGYMGDKLDWGHG